jgi:hypothetical protein
MEVRTMKKTKNMEKRIDQVEAIGKIGSAIAIAAGVAVMAMKAFGKK